MSTIILELSSKDKSGSKAKLAFSIIPSNSISVLQKCFKRFLIHSVAQIFKHQSDGATESSWGSMSRPGKLEHGDSWNCSIIYSQLNHS